MMTLQRLRHSFLYSARLLLMMGLAGAGVLRAGDFVVEGTYAVHAMIGSGLGSSVGIFHVHRDGTLDGYALVNLPTPDGTSRRTIRINVTGTVTVNEDGSGQAIYGGPLPDGTIGPPATEDFVITKAERRGRSKILAVEIVDQREEPSILLGTAHEVRVTWNRLPDDGDEW